MPSPSSRAGLRRPVARALEWALLALALLAAVGLAPIRALVGAGLHALVAAVVATPALLAVDPTGTAAVVLAAAARATLFIAPTVVLVARGWRPRPLTILGGLVLAGLIGPFCWVGLSRPEGWALGVALSGAGVALARLEGIRAAALLPFGFAAVPMLTHSSDLLWSDSDLAALCSERPGTHPEGLEELVDAGWYSLTPVGADRLLLAGWPGFVWIERTESDAPWRVARRLDTNELMGNFWRGCTREDLAWLVNIQGLIALTPGGGLAEHVPVPIESGAPSELDLLNLACDEAGRIWIGEYVNGGVWRRERNGSFARFDVGGVYTEVAIAPDGAVLAVDSTKLYRLDPESGAVTESGTVAQASLGFAVCPLDGAVVVADLAGRVRELVPEGDGFRMGRSLGLTAPRRIAYSPGCERIAVTSADDRTLTEIDRASFEVAERHPAGPSLRDVTYLGDGTLAVVDACGTTLFD